MQRLIVFNNVSLDGYFVDRNGDLSWAYNSIKDEEWDQFVAGNASGGGTLLLGRKTYEMMVQYWPTPAAMQNLPAVAKGMNSMPKVVFSRSMDNATWQNTRLVKGDLVAEVHKLKQAAGPGMAILGSGSIVAQLAPEHLIDEYQVVINPIVLGDGRTMFEGVKERLPLKTKSVRSFKNGNVVLTYEPVG